MRKPAQLCSLQLQCCLLGPGTKLECVDRCCTPMYVISVLAGYSTAVAPGLMMITCQCVTVSHRIRAYPIDPLAERGRAVAYESEAQLLLW